MQGPKRHWSIVVTALSLAAVVAGGCASDLPTEVAPPDPEVAFARSAPAYTSANLGVLAGDNQSRAIGVNDAGEVTGWSCCAPRPRAIVTIAGAMTALPGGADGNATAISNGTVRHVVGYVGNPALPVRWSITGGAASQPTYLAMAGAAYGFAFGVNDAGEATGNAADQAALWDVSGNLTIVAAPEDFVVGRGRDINNAGHAVINFSRPEAGWNIGGLGFPIGYLRLASGELIALPPAGGNGASQANGLSAVTNDLVTVAGTSYPTPSSPRATRWTVNIVTKALVGTAVRPEASYGYGVSDGGIVAGYLEGAKQAPFRWQGGVLLKLSAPKGSRQAVSWAISPNGLSMAGEAQLPTFPRAILWTFPSA